MRILDAELPAQVDARSLTAEENSSEQTVAVAGNFAQDEIQCMQLLLYMSRICCALFCRQRYERPCAKVGATVC